MEDETPPLFILTGPTACGKTGAGVEMALRLGTEIISADSVQVYKHFDIGAAKPSPEQMAMVRHHLVSVARPEEEFNAARFRDEALPIASALWAEGKLPLVVGGTGLYIKAITQGLNLAGQIGKEAEAELERLWNLGGQKLLYERLQKDDPEWAARIHPNDTFRTRRGVGVLLTTGRRMSQIFAANPDRPAPHVMTVVMDIPREILRKRISTRMEEMLSKGWTEELNMLKEMGYNMGHKPMRAIGYKEMFAVCEGTMDLLDAEEAIVRGTWALARRQMTWWRSVKNSVVVSLNGEETAAMTAQIILSRDEVRKYFSLHGVKA
ncbi:MAG: tRNA (adenosine(37)-N6)-dimethylallyltransferase MiaA [Nitrospinota bacterium]|nr:tRNA (adenosine(37)-N6)-dimethylallyltransferase MiaA [Nitrospinota bacterium]